MVKKIDIFKNIQHLSIFFLVLQKAEYLRPSSTRGNIQLKYPIYSYLNLILSRTDWKTLVHWLRADTVKITLSNGFIKLEEKY